MRRVPFLNPTARTASSMPDDPCWASRMQVGAAGKIWDACISPVLHVLQKISDREVHKVFQLFHRFSSFPSLARRHKHVRHIGRLCALAPDATAHKQPMCLTGFHKTDTHVGQQKHSSMFNTSNDFMSILDSPVPCPTAAHT